MTNFLKNIFRGILVSALGLVFAAFFAAIFNGIDTGSACVLGMGVYLCIVVVTCTGIIVSKLNTKGQIPDDKKE